MKLLALLQPGTVSRGLMHDIVDGYEQAGHDVLRFELEPLWSARQAMAPGAAEATIALGRIVAELIEKNGIDLTVAMWGNGTHAAPLLQHEDGRVQSFFDRHAMPMLHYWWDAPHWWLDGAEHENIRNGLYGGAHQLHCINNAATGTEMASLMGFRNVLPLPNAVDPSTFSPSDGVEPEYDLVFVSGSGDPPPTPVMLEELERDDPDVERIRRDVAVRLRPALESFAATVDGSSSGPTRSLLDAMVEARLGDRHAPALVHVQRAARVSGAHAVAADALLGNLGLYLEACSLIRSIETWERPFLVAYLSRHFKCLRLGEQGYDAWGVAGDATGLVPYERQREQYARGRAALNVMRWQDDVGLNSKVFEITACRALCLQAWRGGLEQLFEPGREVLAFRTPGEARAMLRDALDHPDRAAEIASAGYRRTLREHTWAHRAGEVAKVTTAYWKERGRAPAPVDRAIRLRAGSGPRLAFALAPMRSGSTLLRKMLDAHPLLASPPESWFLLPLLSLWQGDGVNERFDPRQAAVALQSIADRQAFVEASRAFASRILARSAHAACRWVVEKTPLYLEIHRELVELFPESRFVVLLRDPRAIAWSLFTWDKLKGETIESATAFAAGQVRRQHEFLRAHGQAALVVRYEQLCADPEAACRDLCRYFEVPYDPAMIAYGRHSHAPPGYGDEGTLAHERPHTASLERWRAGGDASAGMSADAQIALAGQCGIEALVDLGFDELAEMAQLSMACAPAFG